MLKIFEKIKNWLTGSSKSTSSSGRPKATTVSNYGGGGSKSVRSGYSSDSNVREAYRDREDEEKRRRQEAKRKQDERTKAFESISKRTDALSSGKPLSTISSTTGMQTSGSGRSRALERLAQKTERATEDPKQTKLKELQDKRTKELSQISEATHDRYNVDKGTARERLKARQRIKSGEMATDPTVARVAFEQHPVREMMGRKFAQGASFGLADLAEQKLAGDKYKESIDLYKKTAKEHPVAALGSEMAGGLVGFGLTGGASKDLVGGVARKVAPNLGERAVANLASKGVVRNIAEKEMARAVASGAVEAGSEELLQQLTQNVARRVVNAVGADMAINLTTGAIADIANAELMSEKEGDFAKNLALNAGMNLALGGATTVLPAMRSSRGLINRTLRNDTAEFLERLAARDAAEGIQAPRMEAEVVPEITPEATQAPVAREAVDEAVNMQSVEQAAREAAARDVAESAPRNVDEAVREVEPPRAVEAPEPKAKAEAPEPKAKGSGKPKAEAEPKVEAETKGGADEELPYSTIEEDMPTAESQRLDKQNKPIKETKEEKLADAVEEHQTNKVVDEEAKIERRENLKKLKEKENKFKKSGLNKGEKLHRKTVEKVEGSFEEATKPASAKDIIEAEKKHTYGQASDKKEVVSRAGTSLQSITQNESEAKFVKELVDDGKLNYSRTKNKEKYEWAVRQFSKDPEAVSKKLLEYADDFDSIPTTQLLDTHYQAHAVMKMMRKQLDNPSLSAQEKEAAKEIYSAAASLTQRLSSLSGQINQFQGVMVHCDGKTRMRNAVENIVDLLDASRGFRKSKAGKELDSNLYKRKNQIKAMVLEDKDASRALEKIINATTEEEYGNAMTELLYAAHKMDRKTPFDYLTEWRYLAMLGNPKTHIRNILGNVTFGGIRQMSNMNRSFLEKGFENYAVKHGIDIDRHGGLSPAAFMEARRKNPTTASGKAAKEWCEKHLDEIIGTTKYEERPTSGEGAKAMKWLDAMSDLNSKALSGEDNFFRKRNYKEQFIKSYEQYKKDGKEITDELLEKIHREAVRESQVATFNEFNSLAQTLNKWAKADYNSTTGRKIGSFAINAVMPFTKVPANILNQSINYSPIGVGRGVANIMTAAKSGDSRLFNTALDQFASGLTGTAIATLGFFLGKNTDMFTTNAGKNDAASKFKKAQGVQNYSVRIGDKSYTLDFLTPTASTFFTGVEIANQLKRGYGNAFELMGDIGQVTSRVIEPVLETSMLSGLYNIVEDTRNSGNYGDDDKQSAFSIVAREIAQSYLNSLVPTAQGQLARTAYKSDLQLTGENDWEYWVNATKYKMGLANTNIITSALGADTDAYGNVKGEKKNAADYGKALLRNTLSPSNIQKVDLSELDEQKIKTYEDAVKGGADPNDMAYLFPKKQYKKDFKVGKADQDEMDVKLSNRDLSTYNQAKTTGGAEGMRVALESIMFNRYDKDEKGNKTLRADGYTKEDKQKLIDQFEGKSIRDVEKWLYEQPQFKNASPAEQKRVIDHLWSYSTQGKSQGSKRVGEQAVIKAQGGDVDEYNFKNEVSDKKRAALLPAVEAGILTYGQIVDFARNAGKTYYYEDDEGGTSQTYFNKAQMLEYLENADLSEEAKAELFNSFKAWNAKEYGKSSYRRYGRRRRGYRRWHRGGGGGSSKKVEAPKPKTLSEKDLIKGEALGQGKKKSKSSKATPPVRLERVQRKTALPKAKW